MSELSNPYIDTKLYSKVLIKPLQINNDIYISKAKFNAITVQLDGTSFFDALREKLFWGQDSRNIQ